ncbi:MAG: dimethyl sulfoxide reductase anchor subunit family protein [Arenimonas sp.]
MHPAFSVIFFTTLSGMGYGLWFFVAMRMLFDNNAYWSGAMYGLVIGFVLTAVGLLSSTLHLGKPLRAWRAFSQWRSSWLSREGVLAVACFIPAVLLITSLIPVDDFVQNSILAIALAALSLATVACTAMIYASLKPIPAWQHAYVVPVYMLFAWLTGGLLCIAIAPMQSGNISEYVIFGFILIASLLGVLKKRYWKDIDSQALPSRASALGLKPDQVVSVFERPHTEANYLTTEMGFVLARKHSKRLRMIALLLFAWLPILFCVAALMLPQAFTGYLMLAAVLFVYAGAVVERWLFFAEAKHAVMQYY